MSYNCETSRVHIFLVTLMFVYVSSKKKMPIEIFNILFESTQKKQHNGTKITCVEAKKKFMVLLKMCYNF